MLSLCVVRMVVIIIGVLSYLHLRADSGTNRSVLRRQTGQPERNRIGNMTDQKLTYMPWLVHSPASGGAQSERNTKARSCIRASSFHPAIKRLGEGAGTRCIASRKTTIFILPAAHCDKGAHTTCTHIGFEQLQLFWAQPAFMCPIQHMGPVWQQPRQAQAKDD